MYLTIIDMYEKEKKNCLENKLVTLLAIVLTEGDVPGFKTRAL